LVLGGGDGVISSKYKPTPRPERCLSGAPNDTAIPGISLVTQLRTTWR